MSDQEFGIIYILTNKAMPGLVKIGQTSRSSVHDRLKELFSTGVPWPFKCAFAGRIRDEKKVERALHKAFGPYRLHSRREFFEINPEQAITLLELMIEEDVTPALQKEADSIDIEANEASKKYKSKRPPMNFVEMGMPIGSTLQFINGNESCQVASERKVSFDGEEMSLTNLTQKLLDTPRPLQPSPYWEFKGKRLIDIYDETYEMI